MTTANTGTPPSILTRPSDTNAYAQNDLIATSTAAGSVVVPYIQLGGKGSGNLLLRRFKLYTNVTTGWDAATFSVRFWSAAPTYTNGDNGAYVVATGSASYQGKSVVVLSQFADGAVGIGTSFEGSDINFLMNDNGKIYWDLQYTSSGALSPISGQTITMICEFVSL